MLQSWVQVCNASLVRAGLGTIASLDEASEEASKCRALLSATVDYVLSLHPWSCSIARQVLALIGESGTGQRPVWPYRYGHSLPVGMLRAIRIETGLPTGSRGALAQPEPFVLEVFNGQRVLLCNLKVAQLVFVFKPDTPTVLSPPVRQLVVLALSKELSFAGANSMALKKMFHAEFELAMGQAMLVDASEEYGFVPPDNTYIRARSGVPDWWVL